jgi:hypothetical protein
VGSAESRYRPMVGSSERNSEFSGYITDGNFLVRNIDYNLPKKNRARTQLLTWLGKGCPMYFHRCK